MEEDNFKNEKNINLIQSRINKIKNLINSKNENSKSTSKRVSKKIQ